jgi:hypothetical protein
VVKFLVEILIGIIDSFRIFELIYYCGLCLWLVYWAFDVECG